MLQVACKRNGENRISLAALLQGVTLGVRAEVDSGLHRAGAVATSDARGGVITLPSFPIFPAGSVARATALVMPVRPEVGIGTVRMVED